MFENLTNRLNEVFDQLRRRGKLSEADVDEALKEVRRALLEADVNYVVVKDFVARVRERAVGHEVSKALNPGQQVIKIEHEELISTLGDQEKLNLTGPRPRVILLVGLQGSGKTTTAAKLAKLLRAQGERIMLVAADPYRPAAVQQLQVLGEQLTTPVYFEKNITPPVLTEKAYKSAMKGGYSLLIIDTAGRSQLDAALMSELESINKIVKPAEVLLVVDAMIGQESVNIAKGFREVLPITGLVMTKMDGDARGGAAISIRSVTGIPIKYLGVGEDLDGIEVYDPNRLASRILGMGDIIGLIEKAENALDQEVALEQAERMMSGEFTLEDFYAQIQQVKKMGSIGKLLDMMPGAIGKISSQVSPQEAENQLKKTEAIINSMTIAERRKPAILNASRRRRIAKGSGTQVQDVNRLIKQYKDAKKMFKLLNKGGKRNISRLLGF